MAPRHLRGKERMAPITPKPGTGKRLKVCKSVMYKFEMCKLRICKNG